MMKRDACLQVLARHRTDEIVVAVYKAAQEWLHISPSELNYTFTGAMGQGSSHALGLALGRPDKRVVVLEKCLAVGLGGIVSDGVRKSLSGIHLNGYTVIAGLGGRAITRASLKALFALAERDALEQVTFLDLNNEVVDHELERERLVRRSGPTAEAILRHIGTVASRIG